MANDPLAVKISSGMASLADLAASGDLKLALIAFIEAMAAISSLCAVAQAKLTATEKAAGGLVDDPVPTQ